MNLPDQLVGKWIVDPTGQVVGDEVEQRIWEAVNNHLAKIGERECGWTLLYIDPSDESFWELTLPQSALQGGGPAMLTRISAEQISILYPTLKLP